MNTQGYNIEIDARGADLVHRLGGHWRDGGGMCLCPAHDDHRPSLSVRVGHSSLLFKCFAGCDTLDVLRAIRRLALGIPTLGHRSSSNMAPANSSRTSSLARTIWEAAHTVTGTPAQSYLLARRIARGLTALRFHPSTPLGRGNMVRFRPALLAAVQDGDRIVAIQRTFLDTRSARRAHDLTNPCHMLGRPGRGAVMLAPVRDELGVAEGVETALSAMILLDIPVWASLGNARLAKLRIPDGIKRLVLLPDNDAPGRMGEAAARAAYVREGRAIETLWPWHGLNDWNDVLRMKGERDGGRVRQAV